MKKSLIAGVSALALVLPGMAVAETPIKIGLLVALEGAFAAGGADAVRNVNLAIQQRGGTAGGRPIEVIVAPTDTTPDTTIRQARKLVEQDRVDFIIGPLSGSEGIAMRDFAKTVPNMAVINGISGALETTWVDPAPNFFRFNLDGAQWGQGLGSYVVNEKGWKRVASIAADYSFGYTNFLGFAVDFCRSGGEIVERFWVPLGSSDFGGVIAALPDDIDAIYLGMGGTDAINFLNQYEQAGADTNLIGGTIMADATVLSSRGRAKEALIGTPTSGPLAADDPSPAWQNYVAAYQAAFPANERFETPSLFGVGYYIATLAALTALDEVGGDLSDGQAKFMATLSSMKLETPEREPAGDRLGRGDRGCRGTGRQPAFRVPRAHRRRHPDAGHDARGIPCHGPAVPRHARLRQARGSSLSPSRTKRAGARQMRPGRCPTPARRLRPDGAARDVAHPLCHAHPFRGPCPRGRAARRGAGTRHRGAPRPDRHGHWRGVAAPARCAAADLPAAGGRRGTAGRHRPAGSRLRRGDRPRRSACA
jgi:ABC-type branched-subunit amino acid transport system substrate-binding protein